jgi:hypothetical protein
VTLRPQTVRKLLDVSKNASRDLEDSQAKIVTNQLDKIIENFQNSGGKISGRKYQDLVAELNAVKPGSDIGNFVKQLRNAVTEDAEASIPADKLENLRDLNKQYNNFKVVEKLAGRVAGAGGDLSPAALWSQVNARGPKATPEMKELARLGQTILKDKIPENGLRGSALTSILGSVAGGAGVMGGPAGLGLLAGGAAGVAGLGRALNSNTLARIAASRTPGATSGMLARIAAPGSLAAIPVVTSASTRGRRKQDDAANNGP